jgi:hypothetical protein
LNSEQELEGWAEANNIPLSPELYLANQRALILQELDMVGVYVDLPGAFLESLDSQQFAEVIAGAAHRAVNRKKR